MLRGDREVRGQEVNVVNIQNELFERRPSLCGDSRDGLINGWNIGRVLRIKFKREF